MSRETYSAVLEPASDGGWGVTFPLFPGCVSYGRTPREAQANATEALELHIAGMAEDGLEIPFEKADDADAVVHHASGGVSGDQRPVFVVADIGDLGSERVNVYLPKRLLQQIDLFARATGLNRSSFFGLSARQLLNHSSANPPPASGQTDDRARNTSD